MKMHQLRSYSALYPPHGCPAITKEQGKAACEHRLLCHPISHAEQLPDRGTSEVVVFFPIGKKRPQSPLPSRAQRSVMMISFFGERSNFPSLHPRRHDCDPVNSSSPIGHITTNVLKTSVSKKLTWSGHVIFPFEAIFA